MNERRFAGEIANAVVAYCEAITVPELDEVSITAANRVRVRYSASWRIRLTAVSIAALVGLVLLASSIPAVVAGVQRAFGAFSVAAGRNRPMTIRAIDLERARADMPFAVIAPPPIAGAGVVAVDEIFAGSAASDASVVFELRGPAPGLELLIIECDATRHHGPTVFTMSKPAEHALSVPARWPELPVPANVSKPRVLLRGLVNGRTFAPASWVAHGTRIVVMSPPGFLSSAQLQTIRHVMSK